MLSLDTILKIAQYNVIIIITIAGMRGAIAYLIYTINNLLTKIKTNCNDENKYYYTKLSLIIIVILLISNTIFIVGTIAAKSLNESLIAAAWDRYNGKKYIKAIDKAEQCIFTFGPTASRIQREMSNDNTPKPPLGKVSELEKNEIINRGLLNDVATCWYIKGLSLEMLGRKQDAIRAYREAESFSYARTYDQSFDGFWSPAEAANDRILYLDRRN